MTEKRKIKMRKPEHGDRIFTEHLVLRPLMNEDADAILAIYGDEETTRFKPMFALKDQTEAEVYLAELMKDYERDFGYLYGICLREDEAKVIGCIRVETDEPYDMGYSIRRDMWNRRIASEAAIALVEHIRQDGVLPYITATHDENNLASGKVMEHAGLTYRYSYPEQWMPKNFLVTFRLYRIDF